MCWVYVRPPLQGSVLGWVAAFPQPFGLGFMELRPFRLYSELNEEWMKNADGDLCAFEAIFYTRMPTNLLHTPLKQPLHSEPRASACACKLHGTAL